MLVLVAAISIAASGGITFVFCVNKQWSLTKLIENSRSRTHQYEVRISENRSNVAEFLGRYNLAERLEAGGSDLIDVPAHRVERYLPDVLETQTDSLASR